MFADAERNQAAPGRPRGRRRRCFSCQEPPLTAELTSTPAVSHGRPSASHRVRDTDTVIRRITKPPLTAGERRGGGQLHVPNNPQTVVWKLHHGRTQPTLISDD